MASGNEFDINKAFDLYLHDYLVKKKRFKTAAIFREEANVDKPASIDIPDGFLHEWWSIFYDFSRQAKWRKASAGESSVESVITHPVAQQLVGNQRIAGQVRKIFGLRDQSAACLFAAKQYEEEQLRMATQNFDSMTQFVDVNKLTLPNSVQKNSSHFQRQIGNVEQGHGVRDYGYGISLGKSNPVDPILYGTRRSLMSLPGPYAAGASEAINQVALTGRTLQSLNYQQQSMTLKRQPVSAQGMVPMAMKSVESVSSTEINQHNTNPPEGDVCKRNTQVDRGKEQLTTLRDGDKTKEWWDEAEMNETLDELLVSLAQENKNVNITSNSRRQSRTGNKIEHKGFSFGEVGCLHSSTSQVLCCHFSSDGRLLASAGHEKKVLLWNMENFDSFKSSEGHDLLITDIRFKPRSNIFATSSFDKTVKIWDAARPNKSLFQLSGHKEKVMSLDFHPIQTHILTSCDGNDEVRFWNINKRSCLTIAKGATRQVRFQPQLGKLVATATGQSVNVIDTETNLMQFSVKGHRKEVLSMCWDSSGKYIASISEDIAQIWSVSDKKCLHKLQSKGKKFQSCTFHPGHSQLLIIGGYQTLELWTPTDSNKTRSVEAHKGLITSLADCVKSEMVASASHDQCVKVWT